MCSQYCAYSIYSLHSIPAKMTSSRDELVSFAYPSPFPPPMHPPFPTNPIPTTQS